MRLFPRRLRSRLILSHLAVALAALGTVLVLVSVVGPGYFSDAMGHGPGDPAGAAMDAATLAAFQEAVATALGAGATIALVAAVTVAVALSTRISTPLTRLVSAARRIAAGHYAERVPDLGEWEVGDLADSFNAMAGSLEATERRRLELVGDVAHELRTPLAALDGMLEGLQDGVLRPDEAIWVKLRRETSRLTRLVNDLSELWRAEARQLSLHPEPMDVVEVVRDVLDAMRGMAGSRHLVLDRPGGGDTVAVADRDRAAQIIGNLVSNAIRYAPTGPIEVKVSADGTWVAVAVRDHGPGLTPDQLRKVFERFYRVDPSRSRALGGSGVGLAISAALAEAMGGRLHAESGGPGAGSTFILRLPLAGDTVDR